MIVSASQARAKKVYAELKKNYSNVPLLFLNHSTDAQMLCAIILSAQSTDAQVNKVTSTLFKKYRSVNDFASANLKVFETEVKPTGYYHQKAKRVIQCFKIIRDQYGGKIPNSMEQLIELPGVGRKTANLVLANKGIVDGIAVDTHVWRLAQRLGFSKFDDQHKIEQDLMAVAKDRYVQSIALLKNLGDGKQRMDAYRDGQVRVQVS